MLSVVKPTHRGKGNGATHRVTHILAGTSAQGAHDGDQGCRICIMM